MTKIASIGAEVPHDLLAATGTYAGPLTWDIDRTFPKSNQWLESKFALWVFSILEDWANGAFDTLEKVVFTRADDNAQRLYYYVCELQRQGLIGGPEPLLFDVSQIHRETSLDREVRAVRALAERLGVSEKALEAGVVATNVQRAANRPAEFPEGNHCLLAGTPAPDRRLHAMIERAGWIPIGQTLADLWRDPGPRVEDGSGDPYAAVARQVHAGRVGNRSFADRGALIAADAQSASARAAVLWYAEEDEALVWHLPAQRRALENLGVPVLVQTRRDWRGQDGVADQIATFLLEQSR